jgi:streptogramin lyase
MAASSLRRANKLASKASRIRSGKGVLILAALCLTALSLFAPSANAQTAHFSWAMTTVGSGFISPQAVAVDASGNVFVADSSSSTVKKILAASGYTTISTLGSGFSGPLGIAVDANGNVFVADTGNNAVKKILAADGTVTTLGNGFASPSGVAVDASGNVFVADTGNNAVKEILAADGTINTLGGFSFSSPTGVALDAIGNVFVADYLNLAVKEIPKAGNYTTVNTLGSVFSQPRSVAVDANGNIFVADSGNVVKEIMTQVVNFGAAAINTGTPPQMQLTFIFDTAGTIGGSAVLTQGAAGLDFADAVTGDTCTAGTTKRNTIYSVERR